MTHATEQTYGHAASNTLHPAQERSRGHVLSLFIIPLFEVLSLGRDGVTGTCCDVLAVDGVPTETVELVGMLTAVLTVKDCVTVDGVNMSAD